MYIWIFFFVLISLLLALDLGVFHKSSHVVSAKESLRWTAIWATLSFLFSGVVYLAYAHDWIANPQQTKPIDAAVTYLTGYLVEFSLSLDNIFVIALIFTYFAVPRIYQHRVLFWGILGAVFFRALMIGAGIVLIRQFAWMTYVFGVFLLYTAYRMLRSGNAEIDPRQNPAIRLIKRFFPITKHFEGDHFFVRRKHILAATPLFVALVVVETSDILFAIDSIPAILAITTDPFLVFSSNIFAILGLRSLYFALASMLNRFHLLHYSLVFILAFVAIKMLLAEVIHFPEWISLVVIALSILAGIFFSLRRPPEEPDQPEQV